MNKITWIIFSIVTFGLLTGLIVYTKMTESPAIDVSKVDTAVFLKASKQNGNIADHSFGKADSKVTFIEYGDYQCPPCGSTYPTIKKITTDLKDRLHFIFRNFPISTSHPNAKAAAGTAEAAGLQGKFWEMHDKIYESQDEWSDLTGTRRTDVFIGYARKLGLDINQFKLDLASSEVTSKINFDIAVGQKAKVNATPSFYLNGKKLDMEKLTGESALKDAIEAELKKAGE